MVNSNQRAALSLGKAHVDFCRGFRCRVRPPCQPDTVRRLPNNDLRPRKDSAIRQALQDRAAQTGLEHKLGDLHVLVLELTHRARVGLDGPPRPHLPREEIEGNLRVTSDSHRLANWLDVCLHDDRLSLPRRRVGRFEGPFTASR
jgi:hypothetical protein